MIRVELPQHLRTLARTGSVIEVEVAGPVTTRAVIDAIERTHPVLRGTLRDPASGQRRAFVRFFACREDWSLASPDAELPPSIADGSEPLLVIGAIAGG